MSKLKIGLCLLMASAITTISAFAITKTLTIREEEGPWEPKGYSPVESLVEQYPRWQVYAGASWVNFFAHSNNITFSYYNTTLALLETDQLAQSSKSDSPGFLIGFDRMLTYANADETKVRGIAIGGGFQIATTSMSGQVYTFQTSSSNNFNYRFKARPYDFAAQLNVYVTRFNKLHMLPFVLVGGGFSMTDVNFKETVPTGASPAGSPFSSSDTCFTPLFLIGAGLQFDIGSTAFLRTQYVFHYRGKTHLHTNLPQSTAIPLNLNAQSLAVMLGVRFA